MFKRFFLRLLNAFFFYFGWWYCMREAVGSHPYRGPMLVGGILVYHLLASHTRVLDFILIVIMALTGTVVDTLYVQAGMIAFKGGYVSLPTMTPLWITSLWALYAISINHSLDWLKYSWLLAATLGAAGAVSSYLVGIRIGAADLLWSEFAGFATIAFVWALVVPFSILLNQWLKLKLSTNKLFLKMQRHTGHSEHREE